MTYPRLSSEIFAAGDHARAVEDWDTLVLAHRGFTASGTFISPYSYIITQATIDLTTYYYALNAYQILFGGPSNAGGVDGTDANAVIVAVKTSLSSTGGSILIREGTYPGINFTLSEDNIIIVGTPTTILDSTGYATAITITGTGDALIGLTFTGDEILVQLKGIRGRVENCVFACADTDTNHWCIYVSHDVLTTETYNIIQNNTITKGEYGILVFHVKNNFIIGNVITEASQHCIRIVASSYTRVIGNDLYNAHRGVIIDHYALFNVVSSNTIHNMAGEDACGIVLSGQVSYSVIDGNTIYDMIGTVSSYGINMEWGQVDLLKPFSNIISNNNISSIGCDGIIVFHCDKTNVTGNICINCGSFGEGYNGIHAEYSEHTVIVANICNSNRNYGIYINDNDYTTVALNTVRSNATNAIYTNSETSLKMILNSGYNIENYGNSTGTGAEQTIAHGLIGTPHVTITPTVSGATVSGLYADSTNIYVTVTSGKTYFWSASF